MRSLLTKIAIRKAVGLYLGDDEVAVSKVASTPLGPVEIASSSERCTPEDLPGVIERLLLPLLGRKRRVPVAVGLPTSRLFFGTRLTSADGTSSPEAVLQKALCSSNISVEDLTADLLRGNANRLPIASVAACRKKYMAGIVANLSELGIRPVRCEPLPCALVRLAAQQHRPPRRSKMLLRVFLGATHGLVVVILGNLPIAWRSFALPMGSEGLAILSAARTLRTQHHHYGIETTWDYALVHGRADLHERLQQERFATAMATRVVWHDGPTLDGPATALGLAVGCLAQDIKAFDLSRTLKARAPIKEIFPWGELSFAAGLIGCMGLVLGAHSVKLDDSYATLRAQNGQHACLASGDPGRLEKDKKALSEKLEAVRTFLEGRVQWTGYIRDLSERMPANAHLNTFYGKNPLNFGGKSKAEGRSFQLVGTVPLSQNGSIPRDIDAFLRTIQRDPLWKHNFSSIVTDIKLPMAGQQEVPEVDFTITCLNKESAKPAKAGGPKKKEGT